MPFGYSVSRGVQTQPQATVFTRGRFLAWFLGCFRLLSQDSLQPKTITPPSVCFRVKCIHQEKTLLRAHGTPSPIVPT